MSFNANEALEELRGLASLASDGLLDPSSSKRLGQLFFQLDGSLLGGGVLPDGWAYSKLSKSNQQ